MKKNPVISICMPTFNNCIFLEKQLKIIYSQTIDLNFFFFEFVICDNGSKDKTREIVKYYQKKYVTSTSFSIKYYRNKKNIGYHRNLLKSIKNSSGKYLLFLGDDDLPGRNIYKKLFSYFSGKEIEEIIVLPINYCPKYKKYFFGYNLFSHLFMRFSQTSGILINKNNFSKEGIKSTNLYLQVIFLLNYYFKFGVKLLNIKNKIYIGSAPLTVFKSFSDKMNRPKDFGLKERFTIIDRFLKNKKINYIEYLWTKRALIYWLLDLTHSLYRENQQKHANNFFSYIYYLQKNKILFFVLLSSVLLDKIFRSKNSLPFIKIYFTFLNNEFKKYFTNNI
jgi:glycosyltransferase involved in cell wall biosynthesis